MKKYVIVLLIGVVLSAICAQPLLAASSQNEILIGLIPEMNVFKQMERFRPLADYLSKKTGVKVNVTILSRYGNILERFTSEKMDGAFFGSFTGAMAIEKLGVQPIARPVNLDGESTYHGHLFVRADSRIRSVADMKGKKMAFVEKATTAGYIFPLAYLKKNGVQNIDTFFSEYFFTGSHDAALYAVLDRKADIGAAKNSMVDWVIRKDPKIKDQIHIIADSAKVPSNGLCLRKGIDEGIRKKLKDALLTLDKDPDGKAVLDKFGALKFIETTVDDYKPVFDLAKEAGIDIKTYNYKNE